MSEWSDDAAAPPPPQEHVLSAVGVLGASPPLTVSPELLAGVPAQALLDALAQKSKAELGHFSQDLSKVTEKLGKRLVPIREEKLPQGCVRCYTSRARCDGKRPCGRCISRNIEAQCMYPTDPDYVPQSRSHQQQKQPLEEDLGDHAGEGVSPSPSSPPDGLEQATARRQKRENKGSIRAARREGVTASGDILCPHGIEKRYCLDPGCVANGCGKAMCQHGRRRRCCKEPECKGETERKRQEVEARRCVHGRQKRLCREGDCLKEFSAASKAYREMMQQRRSEELQPAPKAPPAAKGKACVHPDCTQAAMFGLKIDGQRVVCRLHKEDDHVDLSKAVCTVEGCIRFARFGEVGARPLTCVHHRQPHFVDYSTKRCEHVEADEDGRHTGILCLAGANYGDAHERKRRYCRAHKRPNDVLLAKRRKLGEEARHDLADPNAEATLETDSVDDGDGELDVEDASGDGVGGGGVGLAPGGGGLVGGTSQGLARAGYFTGLVQEAPVEQPAIFAVHPLAHKGHAMQVDATAAVPISDGAQAVEGQGGVVNVDAIAPPVGEGDGSVVVGGGEVVVDAVGQHQSAQESVEQHAHPPPPDTSHAHEAKKDDETVGCG